MTIIQIQRVLFLVVTLFLLIACSDPEQLDYSGPFADWPTYGGAPGGGHYSAATQITPANVYRLEKAWEYRSGDVRYAGAYDITYPNGKKVPALSSAWQLTPLLINNTLYGCTAFNRMFALNPDTGKEIWSYNPNVDISKEVIVNCRGVSSWQDSEAKDVDCNHRIIMGTMDGRLIAVDGRIGTPCKEFGENGEVNLKAGLGELSEIEYSTTSPPAILGDKIIIGAMVLDKLQRNMPGGVVRAYDARSGKLLWFWDPIPPGQQTEFNYAGQPQFTRSTTNVWSIISVDVKRNLIFLPTGNTSVDYFGGLRKGSDYYSSSVVALDGNTGKVVWHFQMVHHDIWDYDTPAQPTLFDIERDGRRIPALAQPTKMGHLFVLNRETGEPLFPVEERIVPQEFAVADENLSPTQPFPTKPLPLHPSRLDVDDAWGLTFWDRNACVEKINRLRNNGIFTPPSLMGSMFYPSDYGGNNWDTPAIDPRKNVAILNTRFLPASLKLVQRKECDSNPYTGGSLLLGTPYCVDLQLLLSPLGFPCNKPPWGVLVAIDLNKGEINWQVPLGTLEEIAPWPLSQIKGPPNIGGPTVTASGLIFIAGTPDQYLRAFSTETGQELWKAKLPTGGHANPMTYRSTQDGKQYVLITAGGHFGMSGLGQLPGDYIVAFALTD